MASSVNILEEPREPFYKSWSLSMSSKLKFFITTLVVMALDDQQVKGSDVATKVGLLSVHGSNFGQTPSCRHR